MSLENMYNLNLGQIVTLEIMKEFQEVAKHYNLPVYLDGAGIFNASIKLGVEPSEFCMYVDTAQFCLTKGLGCPFGSALVGTKEFIKEAKINCRRLGGGMKQAGIILKGTRF
ncbi:beta-eliminating lyase-related protein [Sporosarcina highlanderae]|uniref:beta-eliminating lyase-related protein n=1 Tax=Sporosarcina highlanderae TaxID=3035916 RepID=UPI0034229AD0